MHIHTYMVHLESFAKLKTMFIGIIFIHLLNKFSAAVYAKFYASESILKTLESTSDTSFMASSNAASALSGDENCIPLSSFFILF